MQTLCQDGMMGREMAENWICPNYDTCATRKGEDAE